MPIGATIGAIGALGSAGIGAYSASKAADAQVAAQNNALTSQNANFNSALDFQKSAFGTATNALSPYSTAGASVLPTLQGLLTPGASQTSILSQLPGFQFQSQYGTMATTNALAARGLGGSTGPLARGISDYNNGLAGTSFTNLVNSLQGYANMGTSASGALASAAGAAGSNVGNLTANTNNTIGNTETNIGNSTAAGILGTGNALSSGLTGSASSATNALLLSKLLPGAAGGGGIYGSTGPGSSFMGGGSPSGYGTG